MRTKPSIADFAREYAADVIECRRDHLAWPGHADEEELRQRGRDKHQHRGLALLEKTAGRLTHKAGGEHERHREERQIRDPAQCRKSVYSRQDDKEQGRQNECADDLVGPMEIAENLEQEHEVPFGPGLVRL